MQFEDERVSSHSPRRPGFFALRLSGAGWAIFLLCLALAVQWPGPNSIAFADGIHYIYCGLSWIRTGRYLNAFGDIDTWFPPLYPLLIGVFSLGGRIDPFQTARVISACFAIATLVCISRIARHVEASLRLPLLAAVILVMNPVFQESASAPLSESVATALSTAAFLMWLGLSEHSGLQSFAVVGILVALSYLARPEGILLLPIWMLIDLKPRANAGMIPKYGVACLAAALFAAPYAIWLSSEGGSLTFSGKGEVNLAAGRSQYWAAPREVIDPGTLQMRFTNYNVGVGDELRRMVDNWRKILGAYGEIVRWPYGAGLLVLMLVGFGTLVRRRMWRFLGGLTAQAAYLPLLAFYAVQTRYLHATLPALSLLAACGVDAAARAVHSNRSSMAMRVACGALLIGAMAALLEGGTRLPRWAMTSDQPEFSILKEAGERMTAIQPAGGTIYEAGATVGYYAKRKRGRLTRNHLETIAQYIRSKEREEPAAWLALSSLQIKSYHPSVQLLLEKDSARFERVVEVSDRRGRVVVFRVR